jgi:GNAT superfamily N-acetyltransferase
MSIRPATAADHDALWAIIQPIIQSGDTYMYAPDATREQMLGTWFAPGKYPYVAELDGAVVVGTFFIVANQPGLGNHVANAGYMVHPDHRGRGIARQLCLWSLDEARRLGFRAMQFNAVVSTNTVAVRLWEQCGFRIIGTVPKAFRHSTLGYVDTYVMYQWLGE